MAKHSRSLLNLILLVLAFLFLNNVNNATLVSAARKSKTKAPIVKMKRGKKAAPKSVYKKSEKKQVSQAQTVLEGVWKTQELLYDFDEATGQYRETESEKGFIEFKNNKYCPFLVFDDKGLFTCPQYHSFTLAGSNINITYEGAPDLKTYGTWQILGDKLELVLNNKSDSGTMKSKRTLVRPQLAPQDKLKTLNGVWKTTKAFVLDDATGQYKEDTSEGALDIYFSFIGHRFCDAYLEDGKLRCSYGTWTLVGDSIHALATGQTTGLKIKGSELEYYGGGKGVVIKYILQKTNLAPPPLASSSVVQE